jgi:hypothetical protein
MNKKIDVYSLVTFWHFSVPTLWHREMPKCHLHTFIKYLVVKNLGVHFWEDVSLNNISTKHSGKNLWLSFRSFSAHVMASSNYKLIIMLLTSAFLWTVFTDAGSELNFPHGHFVNFSICPTFFMSFIFCLQQFDLVVFVTFFLHLSWVPLVAIGTEAPSHSETEVLSVTVWPQFLL